MLASDGRVLDAASVSDENQIIFCQIYPVFSAPADHLYTGSDLSSRPAVEGDVYYFCAVVELNAVTFEVLDHRQYHGFILIIFGEPQRREVRKSPDMMYISPDVQLHLKSAVSVLKGEHSAPVKPEVRI